MTEISDYGSVIETTLLRGRVRLLQPKKGFHASTDTIFLAAAVPVREKQQVLDVGCGVGSAGFCVMARENALHLTGIDVQEELIDLCHQNARLNGWQEKCRFFAGNLMDEKHVEDNFFHTVLMNPPYQQSGTHTPSPQKIKSFAHGEEASGANLTDWVKYAHRKLKQGGNLVMIHRADRLDDAIIALTARRWFGNLEILPLHSYAGEPAKRVILRARKERYAPVTLHAGIILHKEGGEYTTAAKNILEKAVAI